jgi:hypothetical protein
VLVTHAARTSDFTRLEEMGVKLPHNLMVLDTAAFERSLFSAGFRANMPDPRTGQPRLPGSLLPLDSLLKSFPVLLPPIVLQNSGNDSFMILWALQMMLEGIEGTPSPTLQKPQKLLPNTTGVRSDFMRRTISSPASYDLANEFGRIRLGVPDGVPGGGTAPRRHSRLVG